MLNDDSLMPWGKHKGTKMANVPAETKEFWEEVMEELKK